MGLDARRLGMLGAIGVDVYRLRGSGTDRSAPVAAAETTAKPSDVAGNAAADVVIVCPRNGVDARCERVLAQLAHALGVARSRLARCEVDASLAGVPLDTAHYIVVGAPLARALGEKMSTMQQMRSVIAIVDEAAALASGGAGKRGLWLALKPLARRLRSTGA